MQCIVASNMLLLNFQKVDANISELDDVLAQLESIQTGGLMSCAYGLCTPSMFVYVLTYNFYICQCPYRAACLNPRHLLAIIHTLCLYNLEIIRTS